MGKLEKVEVLLEGLDKSNITSLVTKWREIKLIQKQLTELEEMLKTNIKLYLKERKWTRYLDKESKISVTLEQSKRESIDKEQLKLILTDSQMAQITKITTFERLSVITPETKARLREYVRQKKK